jgi:hypothetical protein
MESHGLFINYEADDLESIHGPICRAQGTHCRGEDWPFETQGNFMSAPIWHQYAHVLEMLTFSLDMPGLSEPQMIDEWAFFYRIFNRYAASVRPPADKWVGGIVALRDGLDSANTDRFPEATFGTAVVTNKKRLLAIAEAFASRGAAEGDPDSAAQDNAMASRSPKAMNDVGWRVLEGNFGNGAITQLAANETSVGWWRVGRKSEQRERVNDSARLLVRPHLPGTIDPRHAPSVRPASHRHGCNLLDGRQVQPLVPLRNVSKNSAHG